MDERSHLSAQIDALIDDLNRASKAMESESIDKELRKTVQLRFSNYIRNNRNQLIELKKSADKGDPLDECWRSFNLTQNKCRPIFRECLDFLEGSLIRTAKIDEGICQISDALLNDLEKMTDIHWAKLTVLGEGESFDQTMDIMRLRFPEFSIWNLPLMAHEFGHLAEFGLRDLQRRDQFPIKEWIRQKETADPKMGRYSRELFCDLFGVYSMGPAFAFACLLLNFDPIRANDDGDDHPSFAKRVYFLLRALKILNDSSTGNPYLPYIQGLEKVWNKSVGTIGNVGLKQEDTAQLDIWLDELIALLDIHLLEAKYPVAGNNGWLTAQNSAHEWKEQLKNGEDISIDTHLPQGTLRDVLNSAWLCRYYYPDKAREISKATRRLIREST